MGRSPHSSSCIDEVTYTEATSNEDRLYFVRKDNAYRNVTVVINSSEQDWIVCSEDVELVFNCPYLEICSN